MTNRQASGAASGRRVLILGGKPDGAVDALRDLQVDITCVASPKHTRALAHELGIRRAIAVNDPANVEDVLLGLHRNRLDPRTFDVVTSALEHGLVAAAVVGEMHAVASMPVRTAVLLRDKPSQKRALIAAGVPVAAHQEVSGEGDLVETINAVGGLPVVMKPPDGAGARDTTSLGSIDELSRWKAEAENVSWLCEKFITGEELHIDGVVRSGQVMDMAVSQYFSPMLTVHRGGISGSAILPDMEHPEVTSAARSLTKSAITAVGLVNGVFHAEIFLTAGGDLVFGEVAGRVGGGRIDSMILYGTGVDLHREWAAAVVDIERPGIRAPLGEGLVVGNLDLHCAEGKIVRLPSVSEIAARPGVVDVELKSRVGSVMTSIVDTNTRAGRAVIAGRSWAEVRDLAYELDIWFFNSARVIGVESAEQKTPPPGQ